MEGDLSFRNCKPDYAFYAKKAAGKAMANASPASVWRQLSLMGGERGYFYLDILWQLRGTLDWLIAGPGLCRRRPHPTELHHGDKIDFWTVIAIEPARRLTLSFDMKTPGAGVLEFLFVDHDKAAYLPDLERILQEGWLRPHAIVLADNIKVPGAPEYRAFMHAEEGKRFRTREHETHLEYQSVITDWMLESEYLGI